MPVMDEQTRLRRVVESLCVGESCLTDNGLWIVRVHNLRFEVCSADKRKVVVGGNRRYRRMSMALIEEVVDVSLDFEAALLRPPAKHSGGRRRKVRVDEWGDLLEEMD
jgi:hypothetical protein